MRSIILTGEVGLWGLGRESKLKAFGFKQFREMKRIKNYLFILSAIYIFGCSSDKKEDNKAVTLEKENRLAKMVNLNDFKYHNLKDIDKLKFEEDEDKYNAAGFKKLTDSLIMKQWFGLTTHYFNYSVIHFYSEGKPIGKIIPLTFIQEHDDYQALVLKLVNMESGKLVDSYELFGGECPGPTDSTYGDIELCRGNRSKYLNDSTLNQTIWKYYTSSMEQEDELRVDSITYSLKINRIEHLTKTQLDSVRIIKKGKDYERHY